MRMNMIMVENIIPMSIVMSMNINMIMVMREIMIMFTPITKRKCISTITEDAG